MFSKSYPCPCCGFLTLSEPPPGTFEICPVCCWEDDDVQFDDLFFRGGANDMSLSEARDSFTVIGAKSEEYVNTARKPLLDEVP